LGESSLLDICSQEALCLRAAFLPVFLIFFFLNKKLFLNAILNIIEFVADVFPFEIGISFNSSKNLLTIPFLPKYFILSFSREPLSFYF